MDMLLVDNFEDWKIKENYVINPSPPILLHFDNRESSSVYTGDHVSSFLKSVVHYR